MSKFISNSSFFTPSFLSASAWLQHIPFGFWVVEKLQPKLLVELGVHKGSSYFSFCQSVKENNINCICYGVDTWIGDAHAGFYGEKICNEVFRYNQDNYSHFSYLIRSTFEQSLSLFKDESIDLLHIDGYHTYESVKKDFEDWLPKLSDTALILMHDIHVKEREFGVHQFWAELKNQYLNFEFSYGYGLGILGVGKNLPKDIFEFLSIKNEHDTRFVNEVYGSLGKSVVLQFNQQQLSEQNSSLRHNAQLTSQQLTAQEVLLEKRDQHIKLLERKNAELFKLSQTYKQKTEGQTNDIKDLQLLQKKK